MWGPQDAGVPAPPLLLLPNNILVLSELQTETPASVILLRRGVRCHRGPPDLPHLSQALQVGPHQGAQCCGWGTWVSRLCRRRTFLWASRPRWALPNCRGGSRVCPICVTPPGLKQPPRSPAPCQGSRCLGTPAFCLAQRVMDGRTDGGAAGAAQAFLLCIWWLVIGTPSVQLRDRWPRRCTAVPLPPPARRLRRCPEGPQAETLGPPGGGCPSCPLWRW